MKTRHESLCMHALSAFAGFQFHRDVFWGARRRVRIHAPNAASKTPSARKPIGEIAGTTEQSAIDTHEPCCGLTMANRGSGLVNAVGPCAALNEPPPGSGAKLRATLGTGGMPVTGGPEAGV